MMEIIPISESKLKIMLSADDLRGFSLSAEELDYANTETKRMFWDVLGRAKHAVGFDTDGHRVLVQLYPSRAGGCEMFITRLGELTKSVKESEREDELTAVISTAPLSGNVPSRPSAGIRAAFGFDTMERMLTVCRRLSVLSFDGESEAYLGDDRRCYLLLSDLEVSAYLPLDEYSFIGEYGTVENLTAIRHFIGEHAKTICASDAVSCLAKL